MLKVDLKSEVSVMRYVFFFFFFFFFRTFFCVWFIWKRPLANSK